MEEEIKGVIKEFFCRGGPPWPPVVLTRVQGRNAILFCVMIKATGGHGGPPLQYVPRYFY